MKKLLFWSLLCWWLTACSTFSVDSDYDAAFDFAKLKTYKWRAPNEYTESTKKYLNNDLLNQRIINNVNSNLQAAGYELITTGEPDFWVNYSVSSEPRVDVRTYNSYSGYAPGWSYGYYGMGPYRYGSIAFSPVVDTETKVTHYEQGTFVLDIVNPKSDKLVWRGTAEGRIGKNTTREQKEEAIKEVVTEVLSRFPPI